MILFRKAQAMKAIYVRSVSFNSVTKGVMAVLAGIAVDKGSIREKSDPVSNMIIKSSDDTGDKDGYSI